MAMAMDTAKIAAPLAAEFDALMHEQLAERRERLITATMLAGSDIEFASLLGEVDTALAKLDNGSFGVCETCHDSVEPERLISDPLMKVCLGCLTDKQRASLEDDLQLASDIQVGLLPRKGVTCDVWNIHYVYEPAGIVSGDYIDIIEQGDEFYFLLGDVSGKGMAASLLMSNLHAMFRSMVPLGLPLDELMSRANRLLTESSLANQFATLICGKANRSGRIEFSNAGHLSPIVISNGVKRELTCSGLPLGMFCEAEFTVSDVSLASGDAFVLFSDGVTEAVDVNGDEFGVAQLMESFNGHAADAAGLVDGCIQRLSTFRGTAQQHDDMTMLAMTMK